MKGSVAKEDAVTSDEAEFSAFVADRSAALYRTAYYLTGGDRHAAQDLAVITRVLGVFTIVFGLAFMGAIPWLNRTWGPTQHTAMGLVGAPLLGVLFGIGWTPCIGPTLAAVQTLAIDAASAGRGAALAAVYCMGLGLPFLLVALGSRKAFGAMGWMRRHSTLLMRIGGSMLMLLGVLMVTGQWAEVSIQLRIWTANFGVPF